MKPLNLLIPVFITLLLSSSWSVYAEDQVCVSAIAGFATIGVLEVVNFKQERVYLNPLNLNETKCFKLEDLGINVSNIYYVVYRTVDSKTYCPANTKSNVRLGSRRKEGTGTVSYSIYGGESNVTCAKEASQMYY